MLEAGDLLYGGPWVAERLADLGDFLDGPPDSVLPVTRAVLEAAATSTRSTRSGPSTACRSCAPGRARLWEPSTCWCSRPSATTYTHAEIAAEPVARNLVLGRYTQFTNLLDLAAVTVPNGFTAAGRPVGVTLFGPAFAEDRLITAAHELAGREAA